MSLQFKKIIQKQEMVPIEVISDEVVVELGMTESQLQSLRWVLICWLGQYESGEGSQLKSDILAIHNALEGI